MLEILQPRERIWPGAVGQKLIKKEERIKCHWKSR